MSKFSKKYPHLTYWTESQGCIELGADEHSASLLRILDAGGTCFEDDEATEIDAALAAGETFLVDEFADRLGLVLNPKTGEFDDV
ncbi:hypothetical protein ACFQ48_16945 [Hymenobacter caeli]|uniref:Uncharacterized protein n=1 Tax=Hymenobacter caeli TaxID=2735894 RepID=A0ABX2FQK5_9BACT|nr:hypothetical protein [Hymenobacter caeli]NRT19394.1 hypothetical protein [Hymenobacter caeli]